MARRSFALSRSFSLRLVLLAALLPASTSAQSLDSARVDALKEALPLEPDRVMEMTATEGSWMSVDVSPDGRTVVFDLLGDLVRRVR